MPKNSARHSAFAYARPILAAVALVTTGLLSVGCEDTKEAKDNFDSRIVCNDYCDKKSDCASSSMSDGEITDCVASCRNSIENNCGNEHQEEANDTLGQCVDQSCAEFTACIVFDAAPECFGFAS